MKNIKYLAMLTAAAMLAACDPNGLDTVKTYPAEDIVAPTLQPMETVEVSQANYDENGNVTFSWTAADFGAAAGVDYSIYMSSENYPDMCLASKINATSYEIDYQTLYNRLIGESYLGLPKGGVQTVPCYVTATTGSNFTVVKSAVVNIDFDIARISTGINMLYVSGDFNSNHADRDGMEEDSDGSKTYRGLINMKNSAVTSNSFNFLEYTYAGSSEGDRYGDQGGVLVKNGGDPIVSDPELSWFTVDLNTGAYTVKTLDGPVRLAGFNGNWGLGSNPEMVYNEETNDWTCTAEYASGNFRLSINDDWGYTFGPKTVADLQIKDGSDVKIYHNDVSKPVVGGDANMTIDQPGRYNFRLYYESADCTWHFAIELAK